MNIARRALFLASIHYLLCVLPVEDVLVLVDGQKVVICHNHQSNVTGLENQPGDRLDHAKAARTKKQVVAGANPPGRGPVLMRVCRWQSTEVDG